MSTARSLDSDDCPRTLLYSSAPASPNVSCLQTSCPPRSTRALRSLLSSSSSGACRLSLFPFSPSPPPPLLLILRPSFVRYQYNTTTHSPPIQSTASHTASPISHLPSYLIHLSHSLSLLRILPSLRSCLIFVWKNPHADKLFLSLLSPFLSSHMQHAPIWLAPCSHVLVCPVVDGRFVCSHGLFLRTCRAVYFDTAAPDADADVTCACLFNLNGRLQRMRNRVNWWSALSNERT